MANFVGLLYVFIVVLIILNSHHYIRKIIIMTFCYIVTLLLIYKFSEIINCIWSALLYCGEVISGWDINSNIYWIVNVLLVLLGLLILIFLLKRERKKREPFKKENWGKFKEYIFKDDILTILVSLFVIILGMVGAGYVNIQNATIKDSLDLIRFVTSGSIGIIVIVIGIGIISPLVDFRFRYGFLYPYENNNAQFIYNLRTRSENIKNIHLGIISFQLFELTKTTSEKNIVYEFNEVWRNDSKYDEISKFMPTKIEVPLEIINLFKRDTIAEIDVNQLNKFTSRKYLSKLSKSRIYVPAPYLRALYDFLFEFFYKEKVPEENYFLRDVDDLKENSPIVLEFNNWIKDWKVSKSVFSKRNRYKSVHYINFFEIKNYIQLSFDKNKEKIEQALSVNNARNLQCLFEDINTLIRNSNTENKGDFLKRIEWIQRFHHKDISKIEKEVNNDANNLVNFSLMRNYKGGKSKKENRGYYNLCIETDNNGEGKRRFVLLLIADTRIINEQIALSLLRNVLQLDPL